MKIPELVELFVKKPYHLDMGRNRLAMLYDCTSDDVVLAKSLARGEIARTEVAVATKPVSRNIKLPKPFIGGSADSILIIGDTHVPFDLPGYLEFCRDVQEFFNCGKVIQIGDLVDYHASSYHETIPEGWSPKDELDYAKQRIKEWERVFPEVTVTLGSHDLRPHRKMRSGMVANEWLKSFEDVYDTPNWRYVDEYVYQGIKYTHGTTDAWSNLLNSGVSVVQGHLHTRASVQWHNLGGKSIFAMQVGCGINDKTYAFEYAKTNTTKSHISCGVVFGGNPIVINKETWDASKAK